MKKHILQNGVRVLTNHQSYASAATIAVFVGVGSRHESPEENGLAHFIEHMVFKGTDTRSARDIANETDMIGGQNNAFTTKEMTCFYIRVLPEYGRTGLELMADMVMHPRFAAEDIDTERGVILEEISMYDDDAEDLAADGIYRCAWAPHAIGASIVGTAERVRGFSRDDILRFYQKHYRPDNIVVSVSGKFDEPAMLEECERLFGDRAPVKVPRIITAPGWNAGNTLEFERPNEQLQFTLAFPCCGLGEPDAAAVSLLNSIAGGAASSRLFQRLREELGLAYSVYSYYTAHIGCGTFIVAAGVSPSARRKTLDEIRTILEDLAQNGVDETELLRAKNQMKASIAMSAENTYNTAMENGRREILGLKHRSRSQRLAQISAVTQQQIGACAREIFDYSKLCSCFAGKLK